MHCNNLNFSASKKKIADQARNGARFWNCTIFNIFPIYKTILKLSECYVNVY